MNAAELRTASGPRVTHLSFFEVADFVFHEGYDLAEGRCGRRRVRESAFGGHFVINFNVRGRRHYFECFSVATEHRRRFPTRRSRAGDGCGIFSTEITQGNVRDLLTAQGITPLKSRHCTGGSRHCCHAIGRQRRNSLVGGRFESRGTRNSHKMSKNVLFEWCALSKITKSFFL
jgi:hypothetical protein